MKPIVIEKQGPHAWHMFVNGEPVVNIGKGAKVALTFKPRPNYVDGAPIYTFKTKSDAEGIAHQVGRYMLNLGDMVYSYVEYRDLRMEEAREDCGCAEDVPVVYEVDVEDAKADEARYEKHIKWSRKDMHDLETYVGAGRDYEFMIVKQPKGRWAVSHRPRGTRGAYRLLDGLFYELEAAKRKAEITDYDGALSEAKDYVAVNSSGKQVAGPYKDYEKAKKEADKHGGVVKYSFEAPVKEASEETSSEEASDGCLPWVKVARDPERYEGCLARARALGPIQTPEAIYNLVGPALNKEDQEVFVVILTDVRFQLRGISEIARGQRSKVGVGVNDVMRIVLVSGAESFCVAHQHPSGKASPSQADRHLTKAIETACSPYGGEITFLDHIVIGSGEYYSIRENKLHNVKKAQQPRGKRK